MASPHQIEIISEGSLRCKATHIASRSVLHTDAPIDNNGKGESFSPTDLTCVSLASCMLTIMDIQAAKKGVDLRGTLVTIRKEMKTAPRAIAAIRIHFKMPSQLNLSPAEQQVYERAAHSCPVSKSLHLDIVQDISFEW